MARCTMLFLGFVLTVVARGASVNTLQENADASEGQANPIRKVVTMLQKMQKKITAEGDKEKDMFDKYMCYCKNSDSTLAGSISSAENKIPEVSTSIEEGAAKKVQLEDEVKSAISARAEAKDAIAKATAIREKENAAFRKESGEYKSNIEAMQGAISAISSGMSGGFLQTNTAQTLRKIALNGPNMEDGDRQELLSFLSGKQSYMPKSGEITGILKTMEDDMSKTLADITADEASGLAGFKELVAAKSKEVQALTKAIEVKSKRVGELAVELVMMKNDLSDTEAALLDDKKFYADLSKNCATKEAEWAEIQKMRALELVALADTIKILNDDDALELFKKTLPSSAASGFLQVSLSANAVKDKALAIIVAAQQGRPSVELGFVALALKGKKVGFEKIVKLIDDMVQVMKKEQVDDDVKKEYCTQQLDSVEDKKKGLEQTVSDLETSIADAKESISATAADLKALGAGIKALDKQVAEATEQRKEEHDDHTELMATDTSAKQLLDFAKNRLNKFYNPKLYKAPPKRTLSFVQVHQHRDEPEAAPEAPKAFAKKTEEGGGVIAMIDTLIRDLDKEMQESTVEEKNSQKEYEEMMSDAATKRAEDSKSITGKTTEKAQLETELEASKEGKASATKELMATLEYMSSLHGECDWLLKNFEVRKEARASEIDAMGKAKAVLNGADFSLLQKAAGSKFLAK